MLRLVHQLPKHRVLQCVLGRGSSMWIVRTLMYGLYTLSATCDAATLQTTTLPIAHLQTGQPRLQQLTEVWREAFPSINDAVAPSSLTQSFSTHKPTAPRAGVRASANRPHPAVARIVVPEQGAISFGSGTLIDVRENFGLVITNWHVVRDASDTIEVKFPDGFMSKARALKVDSDWDLAALIVWRPQGIQPVSIAARAPRPGDPLTICGYGQGNYRCATGRCTQYYAPRLDFPRHMVELDVEARQGDSGGPIFNEQGELAGVLFGAGQGTTLGSFGGRVGAFLATLAPDIGRAEESLAQHQSFQQSKHPRQPASDEQPESSPERFAQRAADLSPHQGSGQREQTNPPQQGPAAQQFATIDQPDNNQWPVSSFDQQPTGGDHSQAANPTPPNPTPSDKNTFQQASLLPGTRGANLFEQVKTALAAVGLVTVVVQVLRVAQ